MANCYQYNRAVKCNQMKQIFFFAKQINTYVFIFYFPSLQFVYVILLTNSKIQKTHLIKSSFLINENKLSKTDEDSWLAYYNTRQTVNWVRFMVWLKEECSRNRSSEIHHTSLDLSMNIFRKLFLMSSRQAFDVFYCAN